MSVHVCIHINKVAHTFLYIIPWAYRHHWPSGLCFTSPISKSDTLTHTYLFLMPSFLCPRGRFYTRHTWIRGGGETVGDFMLWHKGLWCRWTVTPSTQHDTDRRSGHRKTRDRQIALAAMGMGRRGWVQDWLATPEQQRLTAYVKFMVSLGLWGNTSSQWTDN